MYGKCISSDTKYRNGRGIFLSTFVSGWNTPLVTPPRLTYKGNHIHSLRSFYVVPANHLQLQHTNLQSSSPAGFVTNTRTAILSWSARTKLAESGSK